MNTNFPFLSSADHPAQTDADKVASGPVPALSPRIALDPESVKKGLGQLVLTVVELIRQLLEKQALRRIEAG